MKEEKYGFKSIYSRFQKSESKYKEIFDSLNECIVIIDVDGKIVETNYVAQVKYKYTGDEFYTLHYKKLVVPAYHIEFDKFINDVKLYGYARTETIDITKIGEKFNTLIKGSMFDNHGNPNIILSISDVTEMKKIEKRLNDKLNIVSIDKQKAEENSKSKSEFIENLSHQILTSMNVILGVTDLLNDSTINKDGLKNHIELINSSGIKLLKIANDLVEISKIDSKQLTLLPQETNLGTLFLDCFKSFYDSPLFFKKLQVAFQYEVPKNSIEHIVFLDQIRFRQVLDNLILCAINNTNEGYIKLGYQIRHVNNQRFIVVFVSFSGETFVRGTKNTYYDYFRETPEIENSTADKISLGILKGIVTLMEGSIWFDHNKENETSLYFTIPYLDASSELIENGNQFQQELDLSGKVMYINGDEDYSIAYLKEILSKTNIMLEYAHDGQELIDMLEKKLPDLIILNQDLTVRNGQLCIDVISEKYKDLKVIAQTAYSLPFDSSHFIEKGYSGYISKPFNKEEVYQTLRKVLKRY